MNTKKALYLLGAIDLVLAVMYLAGYFILFLKPTGYVIPLAVNLAVLAVVAYRSSRFLKRSTGGSVRQGKEAKGMMIPLLLLL